MQTCMELQYISQGQHLKNTVQTLKISFTKLLEESQAP